MNYRFLRKLEIFNFFPAHLKFFDFLLFFLAPIKIKMWINGTSLRVDKWEAHGVRKIYARIQTLTHKSWNSALRVCKMCTACMLQHIKSIIVNKSIMRANFEKIKILFFSHFNWLSIDTKINLKAWLGLELGVVNDLKVLCLEYTDK